MIFGNHEDQQQTAIIKLKKAEAEEGAIFPSFTKNPPINLASIK